MDSILLPYGKPPREKWSRGLITEDGRNQAKRRCADNEASIRTRNVQLCVSRTSRRPCRVSDLLEIAVMDGATLCTLAPADRSKWLNAQIEQTKRVEVTYDGTSPPHSQCFHIKSKQSFINESFTYPFRGPTAWSPKPAGEAGRAADGEGPVAGCKQDLDVVTGCNIDSNTGLKDELGRVDGVCAGNATLAGIFSRIHVAITTSLAGTC